MEVKKVQYDGDILRVEYSDSIGNKRILESPEKPISEFNFEFASISAEVERNLGLENRELKIVPYAIERCKIGKNSEGYIFVGMLISGNAENKLKTEKIPMDEFNRFHAETIFSLAERFVQGEREDEEPKVDSEYEEDIIDEE